MSIIGVVISLIIGVVTSLFVAIVLYWLNISVDDFFIRILRRIPKGFLIFLTGTNGVGKTSTANNVSKMLGIRHIEVDTLRESLRSQKDLFIDAGRESDFNILTLPTYLLDTQEHASDANNDSNYEKQCGLLSPVIGWVANYYTKQNISAIFEGINISPQKLLNDGIIRFRFILFVELRVSDEDVLLKRLAKKASGKAYNFSIYHDNKDKILNTAAIIRSDFEGKIENVHKISIDNKNLSIRQVTNIIVSEVKNVCKYNRVSK